MKASEMTTNRFGSPSIMTEDTSFLGHSVAEWHEAFTGGFRNTFAELKEKQRAYHGAAPLVSTRSHPIDGHVTLDLASFASAKYAKVK